MKKSYYIKERHNPQLGTYYVRCGQMTKKEAKQHTTPGYGYNVMMEYKTEEEYQEAINTLVEKGERIIS